MASQALSTLVTCTLPLRDLLRLKSGVLKRMVQKLCHPELEMVAEPPQKPQRPTKPEIEHISINKMSKNWDF